MGAAPFHSGPVRVDDYNTQAGALRDRYGSGVEVSRLQKARHRGLLVRFCLWPNFAPVVMPFCDVVALTGFDLVDGKRSKEHVLGYVSQHLLLEMLGDRVSHHRAPTRHLIVECAIDGNGQYLLLLGVRPDLKSAATDLLGEA